MKFVGELGAIELSIIAFSIVFFVLGALTLLIYAMKAFSVEKRNETGPSVPGTKPAPAAVVPAGVSVATSTVGGDDGELIAVITAALACELGSGAVIRSMAPIVPSAPSFGFANWIGMGRTEALQGDMPCSWN